MDTLFYSIYKYLSSHKLLSIVVLIVSTIALSFLAYQIEFEEDITKLIPQTEASTEVQNVLKQVNFADKIIVNIKRQNQGTVDDLTQYATAFIDSVSKSSNKYITQIQGRVNEDDALNTLNFVYNNLPLFLNESDYKIIKNKLDKDSVLAITKNNYKTLISPSGFITKETILKDPLGLSFIALNKLKSLSFGNDFTLHNGFILSKDQNNLLLFISPTYASSKTDKNTQFANTLYALQAQLNRNFKTKASAEYFGGVLIAVANANQIKQDIKFTIGIAMSVLFIILIVFYKKISLPFILFVPTAFGALFALALLVLIRTKISAISLGIGSVLLGITLDYALHILTHIRSDYNIKALYKTITKPILMSSLTTALAFFCLLFLQSEALQDLGLFAGISVLSASIFALLFIPQVYKTKTVRNRQQTIIDQIATYPLHKNKWAVIGLFLVFAISVFSYSSVKFNNNLNALNFQPKTLIEAQERLDALTNISSKSLYLAAYGKTEEQALQINDSVFKSLQELKTENKIIEFSSIASLINSKKNQTKSIAIWNKFWTSERIEHTQNNLIESGNALGFKPSTFNDFYSLLNTKFKPISVTNYSELKTISPKDYIISKDSFTTVTTLIKVKNHHLNNVINTFKNTNQTIVIDRKHMNETFLGNLKTDFNRLVIYSSLTVFLLLLIFYKSLALTLVTAIPIALTWLSTIGVMGLFGVEFNIFNIIISSFIFGLGIDYCIFITNGLLYEYRTGENRLPTYKTSIILSFITTVLGVGVLIFAKHPALHSISLVCLIGILSAVFIAFTIQPLLFKLLIGSTRKRHVKLLPFLQSILSFTYFGLGGLLLSLISATLIKISPISKKTKMNWFHKTMSKFMKSVLYTHPFLVKKIINTPQEDFKKQAVIIANHTSFLDILAIGMLHPKIIFLVNDWVYNSPIFGKAVQLAGFYPVSNGINNGLDHLKEKVAQGYTLMAFPEGTRSSTNKIKRFHKGAFYLAEQFNLDIIPILIHGNSEIIPKGESTIREGQITLKILNRITPTDPKFSQKYSQRAKQIGAYFRSEFSTFRNVCENATYFHGLVLDDYRYKGATQYKNIRSDIYKNKDIYYKILKTIGAKDRILHLSKDAGQLDLLMVLDSFERKINTYIQDKIKRDIVKNSFTANRHKNITVWDSIDEILAEKADVFIIDLNTINSNQLEIIINNSYNLLILLKEGKHLFLNMTSKFDVIFENKSIRILKPKS